MGADDYVLKSNLARLPLAVSLALRHHVQENMRKDHDNTLCSRNMELIKINHELDSFVYSVSHNLRSPLASVLGLVQVAALDVNKTKEETGAYFNMIAKNVTKLDDTLKEIMDYSMNARSEIKVGEVNLRKLIGESFEQMEHLQGHEKTEVLVNVEISHPFYSDVFRISVILDNLISNALKYADASKVKSFIHLKTLITPLEMIMTIRDNGIGIVSECLKKVYTMFYRATATSQGAGLGLYVVKEMVDKLKGSINIASVANEETVVTLTIPNYPRTPAMMRDHIV
jgi:signal transduction histidine kinase